MLEKNQFSVTAGVYKASVLKAEKNHLEQYYPLHEI